jgi:transposase-like protein
LSLKNTYTAKKNEYKRDIYRIIMEKRHFTLKKPVLGIRTGYLKG